MGFITRLRGSRDGALPLLKEEGEAQGRERGGVRSALKNVLLLSACLNFFLKKIHFIVK